MSSGGAFGGATPSATSLQAQLERFQKQLSDCVNCASAKTPQGKADIEAISARISQIEQRIAQTQQHRGSADANSQGGSATPPPSAPAHAGLIDVFA